MNKKFLGAVLGAAVVIGSGVSYTLVSANDDLTAKDGSFSLTNPVTEKEKKDAKIINDKLDAFEAEKVVKIKKELKKNLEGYEVLTLKEIFESEETGLASLLMEQVIQGSQQGDLKPIVFIKGNEAIIVEKLKQGKNNVLVAKREGDAWSIVSKEEVQGTMMQPKL